MSRRFSSLPFPLLLSIRANLQRHPLLTALTALAVATSVALATALEMSARSVGVELDRTADALAGAAAAEVTGGDLGVSESLLSAVASVPGVAIAAPYLQTTVRVARGPDEGAALHVVGVDLLLDRDVRTYSITPAGAEVQDAVALLADPRAVLVTHSFARRLGAEGGDGIPVHANFVEAELVIRGFLAAGGVADAFGGNVAVMDVYALQALLGRRGWLDRIDVVVAEGHEAARVLEDVSVRVAGVASVRPAAARSEWLGYTIASLRTIVASLVVVGALVASLLVYGAISLSVDRRTEEFALLRTVGLESDRARRLVRVDALVLAVCGALIGLPAGVLLSRYFLPIFSGISTYLEDVEIERTDWGAATLLLAFGVGVAIAWAGSLEPSRRAVARSPLATLGAARTAPGATPSSRSFPFAYVPACGAWLALAVSSFGLPPLVRVGLLVGLGLLLLATGVRLLLPPALRALRGLIDRIAPGIGRLAGASLVSRAAHLGITVAAVAGVLAGLTITLVFVESLTRTLDEWIATEYRDSVLVTAGSPFAGRDRELVAPETTAAIRATPGVRAVSELFTANILFRGEEVLLVGQSMDVLSRFGRLPAVDREPAELAAALEAGSIAVSDAFADHFDVTAGDSLTLDTPRGARTFEVAGVFRDYVGPAGSVQLDIRVLDLLWSRDGSYLLAAWTDSPVSSVIDAIRSAAGDRQPLFFVHGRELDRYAGSVLRRFTRLLQAVAGLTAVLGGLAVLNLLLGSLSERRRELALLRAAGATQGQLVGLTLFDGVLVGLIGAVAGIGIGVVCAYPTVKDVIREAFGWSVIFTVDLRVLSLLLGAVIIASLLAASYPAWLARRVIPREAFAPE